MSLARGYGLLPENAEFARQGCGWDGFARPSPEFVESFGSKHMAGEMVVNAGLPICLLPKDSLCLKMNQCKELPS